LAKGAVVGRKFVALSFVVGCAVLSAWLYHESHIGAAGHPFALALSAGVFTIAMAARFPD
jgi:hypothetical protein